MKLLTLLLGSICLLTCLHPGSPASAQTFTQLYSLTAAEGSPIVGRILQASDGNFYGTAQQGGANGVGTFFKITPGGTFSVLHSFDGAGDGSYPLAGLLEGIDGNFYGTTASTIFKITPSGTVTTLHTFDPSGSEGLTLFAPLVQDTDGTFFGSTSQDGVSFGSGTIFKLTTNGTAAGTTLTTLHFFDPESGGVNADGAGPFGGMVRGDDGNFYGTTFSGGANHHGTIFKITPAGAFTTLHVFGATEGECRGALVRDSSGVFYGTSSNQPQGSVFQFVTDGSMAGTAVTTLYSFTGGNDGGGFVAGVVINNDGDLYGVTLLNGANGNGTLFRLTPGGALTTLHAFGAGSEEAQPHAGVILGSDGNVYGTTKSTIFKFVPATVPPPLPPPHGGPSETVFKVKKIPLGNDTLLHFSAQQSGTPDGLVVRVQVNTTPDNNATDWVNLNNGSGGYMTLDRTTQQFVLGSTNYPLANGLYFRALSTAHGYSSPSRSNVVGPFNLGNDQTRVGTTILYVATNGPGAEMNFRATLATEQAGINVSMQATTSPNNEASWVALNDGSSGHMFQYSDPKQFYLDSKKYPVGDPVYFRAVATSPLGLVESISNIVGVTKVVAGEPAVLEIVPPFPPESGNGTTPENPLVYSFGSLHMSAQLDPSVPFSRQIRKIGITFDGAVIASKDAGATSVTVDYTSTAPGDHIITSFATDELGITGYAEPVYIRLKPSAGKTFTMTSSGSWSDPANWTDTLGAHAVPGANDVAVVGTAQAQITGDTTAYVVSLNGGSITGVNGKLTISGFFSITSGHLKNINLTIDTHATLSLPGDNNIPMSGTLTNLGTFKSLGRGTIVPVRTNASGSSLQADGSISPDGFFDGLLLAIRNAGDWLFPRPATRKIPTPPPAASPAPPVPRGVIASVFNNTNGRVISSDSAGIIAQGGGNLVGNSGGTVISNDGATLITNDGGSLITNDGGSIIAQGGGNLIGNDGATIIAQGGGNFGPRADSIAAVATDSGFIQSGGETDLTGMMIIAPVSLGGGVLKGSGVIVGDLSVTGGFLSPGKSAGSMDVLGNYGQGAGGTLIIENGGALAGQYDALRVIGSANLGGMLFVHTINGYTPDPADTFSPLGYETGSGSFSAVSSNTTLSVGTNGLLAQVNPAIPNPRGGLLVNISTRARVETGDDVLIGGFIVQGSSPKRIMIRAIGPSLPVAGALGDPVLELHEADGTVVTNDDWRSDQEQEIIATQLQPTSDLESAIIVTLPPGGHTAIVHGKGSGTGVALVEVYDLTASDPGTLANISTRAKVQTGDNVLIGGFIVRGTEPSKVLVRALGPSLTARGVSGALADPTLELHDANGAVLMNDNWRETQEAEITATQLQPTNDAEAAIMATLVPGSYTAVVRGKNDTTGVALVEVYNLP